jgi:3-hydroxyisobutyrate dehydrogenase-like beta-hydroxyacid dehydrogenase
MDQKGRMMVSGVYTPAHGTVPTSVKDATLMLEQSKALGVPLPLVALTAEALRRAEERGWRDQDWASFLEVLRETAGLGARI